MALITRSFFILCLMASLAACGDDDTCYSPTQHPAHESHQGEVGCACDPKVDQDMCVYGTALICKDGHWLEVIDGPCLPQGPSDGGVKDSGTDADGGSESDGGSDKTGLQ